MIQRRIKQYFECFITCLCKSRISISFFPMLFLGYLYFKIQCFWWKSIQRRWMVCSSLDNWRFSQKNYTCRKRGYYSDHRFDHGTITGILPLICNYELKLLAYVKWCILNSDVLFSCLLFYVRILFLFNFGSLCIVRDADLTKPQIIV